MSAPSQFPEYLTVAEVAAILSVSGETVLRKFGTADPDYYLR
jgi:hypothetical protein